MLHLIHHPIIYGKRGREWNQDHPKEEGEKRQQDSRLKHLSQLLKALHFI